MKKRIIIGLILICFISVIINVYQYNKIRKYDRDESFYTTYVEDSFKNFISGLDYYDGKTTNMPNENAIKNSACAVADIRSITPLSSYKNNRPLSSMLLNLEMFFVMESDEYINKNIDSIKPQLINISNNLKDENAVSELNTVLEKLLSNK